METLIYNHPETQKINIKDVVIPQELETIYNYSNKEDEISALMESILLIGLRKPINVFKKENKYTLIDGKLRLLAHIRLNLNEIDAVVSEFEETDEFSLADLVIHHQIQKQKTNIEKLNEVKTLLRIGTEDKNPLRDKEKRVTLISSLLGGKGWGRNNVFSLEKILRWELKNGSELELSRKVISNELPVNKALEAIGLFENPYFDREKEKESKIVEEFIKGKYNAEKAVTLMGQFIKKKFEGHTVVKLYPKETKNFSIIHGNIEEIQLPDNLLIDTIFTSPPYYKLVKYGDDPNELGWEKTPEEYVKRLCDILMKCYWKLKSTGSMFVNLGETYEDGECLGITEMVTVELKKRGVRYIDRIIWRKGSNKPNGNQVKRLMQGYETILFFSKSKEYHFDRFRIKSEKTLKVSRGCKEKGSNKRNHHIPNNYDQFRNVLSDNEVSNIIKVQINKNRTKHIEGEEVHPATFSSNLPVIPLLITTPKNRNSVVFDPFLGSGSCGVAALLLGFKFVGVELYEKNIQTAERILSEGQREFDEDSLNCLLKDIESPDGSDDLLENNQAA